LAARFSRHDPERQLDSGIVAAHWLTLAEIRALQAQHRSPLVLRCIEDWLAGRVIRWICSPITHEMAAGAAAAGCGGTVKRWRDDQRLLQLRLPGSVRSALRRRTAGAGRGPSCAVEMPLTSARSCRWRLAGCLAGPAGRRRSPPTVAATPPTMAFTGGWIASTTRPPTTRLLRLLEARGWLRFHRVLEPVSRVLYLGPGALCGGSKK
jgi:hypothetical protein